MRLIQGFLIRRQACRHWLSYCLYLIYNYMNYKAILLVAFLINFASSILIVGKQSGWKKCYSAEYSPDKTLQAKLGFLRRERGRCKAIFSVKVKEANEEQTIKETIYQKQHRCEQAKTNDPYVVKHTSKQEDFHGMYEICVEMIENENEEALIQIHLGELLNPIIYEHSENPLPLVQSQELLDLDATIQSIKRGLVKSRVHYEQNRKNGQNLDKSITEIMDLNQLAIVLQIVTMLVFGFTWIRIVRRFKRS